MIMMITMTWTTGTTVTITITMTMFIIMMAPTHESGGADARVLLPLADRRFVEQPAEWDLARGPYEYGGMSAP